MHYNWQAVHTSEPCAGPHGMRLPCRQGAACLLGWRRNQRTLERAALVHWQRESVLLLGRAAAGDFPGLRVRRKTRSPSQRTNIEDARQERCRLSNSLADSWAESDASYRVRLWGGRIGDLPTAGSFGIPPPPFVCILLPASCDLTSAPQRFYSLLRYAHCRTHCSPAHCKRSYP